MKKKYISWLCSFLIVVGIVFTIRFYIVNRQEEQEEYNRYLIAQTSYSTEEIDRFLSDYPNTIFKDMLQKRKEQINSITQEWNRLQKSGCVHDFQAFAKRHPQSPLAFECDHYIDSLEWKAALTTGTLDAFLSYLNQHPNGRFVKEANIAKQRKERAIFTEIELKKVHQIMNRLQIAVDQGQRFVYDSLQQQGVVFSDSLLMNYLLEHHRSITDISKISVRKDYQKQQVRYKADIIFKYAGQQSDSIRPIVITMTAILNDQFEINKIALKR